MMNFEQLANELFLDLFEYLTSAHLLHAFSDLNYRFNTLLIIHFRSHGLDFRSVSKFHFDGICRKHLPSMIDRIIALRLSDDHDTPDQIDLFFSYGFTLHQFVHLQSLTLYHLQSNQTIRRIVVQCRRLPHLTRLCLIKCSSKVQERIVSNIVNTIWRLSQLKYCHLDWTLIPIAYFPVPNIRSKSIEYLSIEILPVDFIEIVRLFRCTPNLRYLHFRIAHPSDENIFQSMNSSISSLNLRINHHSSNQLFNLLQKMSHLIKLTLLTESMIIDGHQFEELIVNYLPNLKVFRFVMYRDVDAYHNYERQIDQILHSFRSSFWLIDRRWFVRCQLEILCSHPLIVLYSLPFASDTFALHFGPPENCIKATCPSEDDYWSFDRVTTLIYNSDILNGMIRYPFRFSNIQHLDITFPMCDQFLLNIPRLDHLISLVASNRDDTDSDNAFNQLQYLIDRAPHLYSLTIETWSSSIIQEIPGKINSTSIRRLDLQSFYYPKCDRCFNTEQCLRFTRSPLAIQCEVLLIVIENRTVIHDLVHRMKNLRALKVYCPRGRSNERSPTNLEIIQWTLYHYPCTFLEDVTRIENKRVWIR
ncbi:unnamed protein product [Rotaria sp. Silwood2]|nr:unnamed protein product [Rotaria sp. Silwood2]CAF4211570.1 unnamed protein product [Rotaria sp. Silwood2]